LLIFDGLLPEISQPGRGRGGKRTLVILVCDIAGLSFLF
jgi:hypothetical protein